MDSARVNPKKPKTPIMNFRIPKDLADQVRARAAVEGETVTQVVVQAFERYVKGEQSDRR